MTLMETWTWTNKILICKKHILVYIDVEYNSCLIRKNWMTRTSIYIYKHMCVHYLKDFFASSEMILTVVTNERTYLTYEKRLKWQKSHIYRGMTFHQCGEWSMFVSRKCKCKSPPLAIKPGSPEWQAGILATILRRNQTNCWYRVYFKDTVWYSIINLPSAIATSLRILDITIAHRSGQF